MTTPVDRSGRGVSCSTVPTPKAPYRIARLVSGDRVAAKHLFSMMADVFGEGHEELSDAYVDGLLGREDLWVLAATLGADVVGGLTAHTLPMTRAETGEIFIYDIAVRADHQRRGVGKLLMLHLAQLATDAGIEDLFVPADDEDAHALEFYRALGGVAAPVSFFTFDGELRKLAR
jgi:aminoglycoside 3-N-acetyltransferase I